MNKHLELAIRALENMRGDDLERARKQFEKLPIEITDVEFLNGGLIRKHIINDYSKKASEINDAIEWIKNIEEPIWSQLDEKFLQVK